jgi:hypothetical protein
MTLQVVNRTGSYRVAIGRESWLTGALVIAPLLDEWTQTAPGGVTSRALTPRAYARVAGTHLVVSGLADQVLAGLAAGPVDVVVELRRRGHLPQRVTITVPMGSVLPYEAPAVVVSSTSICLAGRVTANAFPHGPVAGATVAVTGVGPALVTLSVPLAIAHPAATGIRLRALTPGAATALSAPIRGGASAIRVLSTAGIGSGTLLAIGEDVVVADGTSGPIVRLRTPVAASAVDGATVTIQVPGAIGAGATFTRDAIAGDGLLPVSGALIGPAVEIVDGASTEFRRTQIVADADGRWRIAGVRGIPEVEVTTGAPGFLTDGPRLTPLAPTDPYIVNTSLRI